MLKDLSPNIKSSITRSITQTIEQYFASIDWELERFDVVELFEMWGEYVQERALWYDTLPDEMKESSQFQEDLANRVNELLEKTFTAQPATEEQVANIRYMEEQLDLYNKDILCKMHATYLEQTLQEQLEATQK